MTITSLALAIAGGLLIADAVNTVVRALSYIWLYKRERAQRAIRAKEGYEQLLKDLQLAHAEDDLAAKKVSVN